MPSDAVAMKATASFIREKIIQDACKLFLHVEVQIKHIIWQTYFTRMSFSNMLLQGSSATDASMLPTSFLHGGSFQLERCKTQRVVSAGRYQTESRWFSSCVKSYVGTLSLETSDISMLHNSCNRSSIPCTISLYHNYSPTHLSTVLPPSHESRAKASDLGWLQLYWFWSKAAEV